jgi:hypothetical protein
VLSNLLFKTRKLIEKFYVGFKKQPVMWSGTGGDYVTVVDDDLDAFWFMDLIEGITVCICWDNLTIRHLGELHGSDNCAMIKLL